MTKYFARQSSGWNLKTQGWYRTSYRIYKPEQRKWINDNINGEWTENIMGDVYFEFETDAMAYKLWWS